MKILSTTGLIARAHMNIFGLIIFAKSLQQTFSLCLFKVPVWVQSEKLMQLVSTGWILGEKHGYDLEVCGKCQVSDLSPDLLEQNQHFSQVTGYWYIEDFRSTELVTHR